jgi:hypothetical protein
MVTSRRNFMRMLVGAISLISGSMQACRSEKNPNKDPCDDLSSLSEAQLSVRQQLGYVAQSSVADRTCSNCNLFVKSDSSLSCGSCLAMKGSVADGGYCTVWAPIL